MSISGASSVFSVSDRSGVPAPLPPIPRATGADGLANQADFASLIGRDQALHAPAPASPDERYTDEDHRTARRAAEQFVAIALVQPFLKQVRESSQAAPPFAPGPGEKQFRAMQDAAMSQRLVKAAHFPLVDRLARDLLKHQAG